MSNMSLLHFTVNAFWLLCCCTRSCVHAQVLPATSSDMLSRDRELISAQHDATFIPASQQGSSNTDSMARSKPASLLSMDNGSAASKIGSFSGYDQMQGMQSSADSAQGQQMGDSGLAGWRQQSMSGIAGSQVLAGSHNRGGRHTHQE